MPSSSRRSPSASTSRGRTCTASSILRSRCTARRGSCAVVGSVRTARARAECPRVPAIATVSRRAISCSRADAVHPARRRHRAKRSPMRASSRANTSALIVARFGPVGIGNQLAACSLCLEPVEVLVPNLMPYAERITIWLAAGGARHASIEWNGQTVRSVDLDGHWTPVQFDLQHPGLHTNELEIESDPQPLLTTSARQRPGRVGVAVGDLEIQLL